MALLGRWLDYVFVAFFLFHIPTTILVDSQSALPQHWFPAPLREVVAWHVQENNDTLMGRNPPWFVALVWGEILFQLPFFFVMTYALLAQKKWIRIPALIYGAHTATTLLPIFGHILSEHNLPLFGIYFPYFLIPALLVLKMALMPDPFPGVKSKQD